MRPVLCGSVSRTFLRRDPWTIEDDGDCSEDETLIDRLTAALKARGGTLARP